MDIIQRLEQAFNSGQSLNITESDMKQLREMETTMLNCFAYYTYFEALYGQDLHVKNWHHNDELEPLDSFIESARETGIR